MNKIRRLVQSYGNHIAVPWRYDIAPLQRVIFCVYEESEELTLRLMVDEFDAATTACGRKWIHIDISDTFAHWLAAQKYARHYFEKPELLPSLIHKYREYAAGIIAEAALRKGADRDTVVAVSGLGTLFGFVKVKDLVDMVAPGVPGRLLMFFPGTFEDNNYRLLDGYDGWNYLAIPITPDRNI